MTIKRIKTCELCQAEFTTPYQRTKYCESCRSKARQKAQKAKRQTLAEKRIQKLPQSDEWLWIARQCKRAGTVEILQDVDLVALFAIYKARFKTFGWNPETKTSKFHLCHIQPVQDDNTVGLLHHLNLFIGNSLPNQRHSNKSYQDRGLNIPTDQLKKKWLITDSNSNKVILDKVTKYLGPVLTEYTREYPIRISQRIGLARWLYQNDPANKLTLAKLEQLSTQDLRKIKAKVEGKEVYKLNYAAKRSIVVSLEECQRLAEQLPGGQHQSDLEFMIPVLYVAAAWLASLPNQEGLADIFKKPYGVAWKPLELREGMDASTLRDFISFQAFDALQGAPVDRRLIRNTLHKYLTVTSLSPDYSGSTSSMQNHSSDDYSRFAQQVPVIKNAIITLGLPDKVMLAEDILKAEIAQREEEIFSSLNYEQCEGPLDYSPDYYQVEDDYVPSPSLCAIPVETFCDF
jgi:hypothetical protein